MHDTIKIFSTKKLTGAQLELFGNIDVLSEDFIKVTSDSNIQFTAPINRAIFTSQNAVKSCLINEVDISGIAEVYCVGNKTEQLLLENNVSVKLKSTSSKDLVEQILKLDNKQAITYFCGNLHREELPSILESNKIAVEIVEVYKTELNSIYLASKFDGILFFSPSAVHSYILSNNNFEAVAFCIGETTSAEANKYFKNVIVSDVPLIENVINLAIQYFEYE